MLISNRAVISQKTNKSAAPQFSEPCDCVTASEPCNIRIVSNEGYWIEIDEDITPSRYNSDIQYYIDED